MSLASFDQTVSLSSATAEALESLGLVGHVGCVNIDMPAMAWLVLVLKELPDRDEWFPKGKWATIQHIEGQLAEMAKREAAKTVAEFGL